MKTTLPLPTIGDPRLSEYLPWFSKEEQAANAILWIDSLLSFRKGNKLLSSDGAFCVLGVACKVMEAPIIMEGAILWLNATQVFGLHSPMGFFYHPGDLSRPESRGGWWSLALVNDQALKSDRTFRAMRKFMLENIDVIFKLGVALLIEKHYQRR